MEFHRLAIGLPLGFLIGMITGAIFTFMLKSLYNTSTWVDGLKVIGEMLAIPTFWFGGPWVAAQALRGIEWQEVLPWYVLTLAVVFVILIAIPTIRFVARMAEKLKTP